MPQLPTVQNLGPTPIPNVGGGIPNLNLETPNLGHEAAALTEFGNATQGVGDSITRLAQREKLSLAMLHGQDMHTQYQRGLLDLKFGNKDKGIVGFHDILGGAAINGNLVEDYSQKRSDLKASIIANNPDPTAQFFFARRAETSDQMFDNEMYMHRAQQQQVYDQEVHQGQSDINIQDSIANWKIPGRLEQGRMVSDQLAWQQGIKMGLNPALPKDLAVLTDLQISARSRFNSLAIEQMLQEKNGDAIAKSYFEALEAKGNQFTPEALITLGNKLQISSVLGEAQRLSSDIWDKLGPKGNYDVPNIPLMAGELKDVDPRTAEMALQMLRQKASDHEHFGRELSNSNIATFLKNAENGMPLEENKKTPAFLEMMNTPEGSRALEYVIARGQNATQHQHQEYEWEQGMLATTGYSTYYGLSDPKVLKNMTPEAIWATAPRIGNKLMHQLLEEKRSLDDPQKAPAVQVDHDMFIVAAGKAGMNTFPKPDQAAAKMALARAENQVKIIMDLEQRSTGKVLSMQQKSQLMSQILSQTVEQREALHGYAGRNPLVPAVSVDPEKYREYYRPIDQIPQKWLDGAMNRMRALNVVSPKATSAQIMADPEMRRRLENGYAGSLFNITPDQGDQILMGR